MKVILIIGSVNGILGGLDKKERFCNTIALYPIHTCKLIQLTLNQVFEKGLLVGQSSKSSAFDWLKVNLV